MGRATVRAAIATYLQNAEITNLGQVFAHPPRFTNETDFTAKGYPGQGTGAVIWVYLGRQHERRIALGGVTSGDKMRYYRCTLISLLKSKKRTAEEADADNDAFIDSLVSAIQASRVAGNANVIFQWGEGDLLYGVDIQVETRLPLPISQQNFNVFNLIEVAVMENLTT